MAEPTRDIESLLSDESFQRWLSGKAGSEKQEQWNAWLNEEAANRRLYEQAREIWAMAHYRPVTVPDIETEWQKLHDRLHLPATHTASIHRLRPRRVEINRKGARHTVWTRFGIAAIAAVLVLAWLWRTLPFRNAPGTLADQIIATDFGQRARINLPDSTTIILNAHSRLRYPATWNATTVREFELQGEAYFEVAPRPEGPQHDFVVQTADGNVKVVGTRFVVHERGAGTRVVVEEGGVQVTVADSASTDEIPAARILLKPAQLLHFQKGNSALNPQGVRLGLYTTWWRDELVLEDTPFEHIIHRLEETYGVSVEVKDPRLLQRTLSGSMENRNLDVITKALARALRTSVSREGQVIIFGI